MYNGSWNGISGRIFDLQLMIWYSLAHQTLEVMWRKMLSFYGRC